MLSFLVSENQFILSFFPLCSALVYHGYTKANADSFIYYVIYRFLKV